MRTILLAGVLSLALGGLGYAQSVDVSTAGGGTTAGAGSTAKVTGTGSDLTGGIVDSTTSAFDLSGSVGGHQVNVSGTTGGSQSDVADVSFDTGSGNETSSTTTMGTAGSGFTGLSALTTASHHHH